METHSWKKESFFFDLHVNQFLYGCRSTVEILLSLPWPFWGLNMNFRDAMFILFLLFVLAAPMFILLSKSLAQSPPNSRPESENHLKYKPSSARVSESHSCPHNFRDTPRSSAAQRLIGDGHFGFLRCFDDVNGGIRDLLRKCWAKKFQKQKQPGWKAMRDVGHGPWSIIHSKKDSPGWSMLNYELVWTSVDRILWILSGYGWWMSFASLQEWGLVHQLDAFQELEFTNQTNWWSCEVEKNHSPRHFPPLWTAYSRHVRLSKSPIESLKSHHTCTHP